MDMNDRSPAGAAREIIRTALKASLASLEEGSGIPYASLVTVALGSDGSPLILISELALHTRNLRSDDRASLLFDASDGAGDPLAGGRVTVIGRMEQVPAKVIANVAGRFLARHPSAEMYSGFADFAFWRMHVERAHYIGGFGRIVDLKREQLLDDLKGAEALVGAEADIVAHMNDDHADAVQLYATRLGGAAPGQWRMTGVDPAGFDLVDGVRGVRLPFATRVTSPAQARAEFVRLAGAARSDGKG